MREGCWELVAPDETTVLAETLLHAIVMKDSQCNRCFADPSSADQSHGFEVFGEANNLLNQLVAPKAGPRRWRRYFARYFGRKYNRLDYILDC